MRRITPENHKMFKPERNRYVVHWFPTSEICHLVCSPGVERIPYMHIQTLWTICNSILVKLGFLEPNPAPLSQSLVSRNLHFDKISLVIPMQRSIRKPLLRKIINQLICII